MSGAGATEDVDASPATAGVVRARTGPLSASRAAAEDSRAAAEGSAAPTDGPSRAGGRLAEWMERHDGELRRHLSRMLGGVHDAEDVLQEVWVTAHRKPPDDGPGANVRAWLYRVATNAALDRLAKERRRRGALEGVRPALEGDVGPAPDAFLGGLDEATRARIRESVAGLPRKQREAVWLRWAEEAEYETIAQVLECSPESARANVYQGMKKLREELHEVWKQEEAP